jgi:putative IMPACT (imprinted ancient) family translation regulator
MPQTLAGPARFELEVKHSRFIAQAAPLTDAAHAPEWLREHALLAGDARHHCWAWRVGLHYRSHDADEPAGTAGRPILAAIDAQALDRVIVLVSRWFGGIKLGAGGLARAYGGAAAECLRLAPRTPLLVMTEARLHVPFEAIGVVHPLLDAYAARKLDEHYEADGAHWRLQLPTSAWEPLAIALRDATRGQARLHPLEATGTTVRHEPCGPR